MAFSYRNYKELARREVEDKDYQIRMNLKDEHILVMAPHGGKIEPGTTEIAEAIAGMDYSFYSFEGLKADGNSALHIESHLFDEPRALKLVDKAEIVLTVHGQVDRKDEFVMVGGFNTNLCSVIKRELEAAGFEIRPPTRRLSGIDPMNICNRGKLKSGVQLEMSRKVRDSLRTDKNQLQIFADAIRRAIQIYLFSK
jgi:phage replication-related protein YjqB (UPF0714/DUF867 family)